MKVNKKTFTTKTESGEEIELAVIRPTYKVSHQAQLEYNKVFKELLEYGGMLRVTLDKYMRGQNLWDDSKQETLEKIQKTLSDGEKLFARGKVKLSAARKAAIDMRVARLELRNLLQERNNLDNKTIEGQADNHSFSFLVSACTVYNDSGKPYFKNFDEYLSRNGEQVAIDAASNLANLLYGLDAKFEHNLPENKFLLKYGLCNEELSLVDKDGNLVDTEGNRIDSEGYRLTSDGKRCDSEGNLLDQQGDYIVEFEDFVDDEGNPVHAVTSEPTDKVESATN